MVAEARAVLKATANEPLHCRVLLHEDARRKSAFANASKEDVRHAYNQLMNKLPSLNVAFFLGRVDRRQAPQHLHLTLPHPSDPATVQVGREKLEIQHLQFFAYAGALTQAAHSLPAPTAFLVDENRTMIRWFNQNRRAQRLMELAGLSAETPAWPAAHPTNDAAAIGLQIADMLTYFGTKQLTNPHFPPAFGAMGTKTTQIEYQFAEQTKHPYLPPSGVRVEALNLVADQVRGVTSKPAVTKA